MKRGIKVLSFEIPESMIISTNKIYSGMHYSKRSAIKDDFKYLCMENKNKGPLDEIVYPLEIEFAFTFKKRAYDASNCSFMAKMIEDSLTWLNILKDDSPKYVTSVKISSCKGSSNYVDVHFIIDI